MSAWDELNRTEELFSVGDELESELLDTFATYQEIFLEWEQFLEVLEERGLKREWLSWKAAQE